MAFKQLGIKKRWEQACGVLMALALAVTLFGSLVIWRPTATGGPMSGLSDGLSFLLWLFGLFGLTGCFLQQARGRRVFAWLGLGGSLLALLWSLVMHRCPDDVDFCTSDSNGTATAFVLCGALLAALLAYDKYKEQLPRAARLLVQGTSLLMVLLWAGAVAFAVANIHKPLRLRIDSTPHPVTQRADAGPRL